MNLTALMRIPKGVTAVLGSGGKTTLIDRLAEELSTQGTVIRCTTTRIFPPKGTRTLTGADAGAVAAALRTRPVLCLGETSEQGKLRAAALSIRELAELADYVLVEADGARGLPLKAHLDHEPVIPKEASLRILCVGASGIGRSILTAAHRPERYAELAGVTPDSVVTPELAARVISLEALSNFVFINQAEEHPAAARMLGTCLSVPTLCGSLWRGVVMC